MRIAILTFHRTRNCGALFQAWALQTILERMGHRVEFPIVNHVGEYPRWIDWVDHKKNGLCKLRSLVGRIAFNLLSIPNEDILRYRYMKFRQKYLHERACSVGDFSSYYDLIIVGSDQVWSARHSYKYAPVFFAETLPSSIRKIAYAVSCGDDLPTGNGLTRVINCVERFSAISVREGFLREQLSHLTGRQVDETLDPALLLTETDFEQLGAGRTPNEPYLVMYTMESEEFAVQTAKGLARRLGMKCVIVPCYQRSRLGAPKGLTYGISPDRLIRLVKNSKYVLARSFHGTVLALLFQKPFLSIRTKVDEKESRQLGLLKKLGCARRLVDPSVPIDEMYKRLMEDVPDYSNILQNMRQQSIAWLRNSVDGRIS